MIRFKNCLKDSAFRIENSKGRKNAFPDEDKPYFNCVNHFIICSDKILQSKARRRTEEKTQVLCDPENSHARTRSRHTNEVTSNAVKISDIVGLNTDLCRAISEGHDIGHTPYGHIGEEFISETSGKIFEHEIFGVVISQHIERHGQGLNLSLEVLEGMLNHSRGTDALSVNPKMPLEYAIVMFSDKITYTFSDINDALRYGHLEKGCLPKEVLQLGKNQRERILACIFSLIKESSETGSISFSRSETAEKFEKIRQWMYKNYYSKINWKIQRIILERVYEFLSTHRYFKDCEPAILLALMTDREVNDMAVKTFLRGEKPRIEDMRNFGIMEIIPYIRGGKIDFTDPDLNWGRK